HYTLRIPSGTASTFVANYDDLAKKYGEDHQRVTLRFGETIEMVAADSGVPSRVLREINGYSRRERAPYGSELIVPGGLSTANDTGDNDDADKPVVIIPQQEFELPDRARVFYRVNRGD